MSVAKRDGVSGAGSHQSTRSQRATANGREGPRVSGVARRGEEERGREREERRKGNNEEKGRRGSNEERAKASRASLERRREGGTGLSGQMNRNREVSGKNYARGIQRVFWRAKLNISRVFLRVFRIMYITVCAVHTITEGYNYYINGNVLTITDAIHIII